MPGDRRCRDRGARPELVRPRHERGGRSGVGVDAVAVGQEDQRAQQRVLGGRRRCLHREVTDQADQLTRNPDCRRLRRRPPDRKRPGAVSTPSRRADHEVVQMSGHGSARSGRRRSAGSLRAVGHHVARCGVVHEEELDVLRPMAPFGADRLPTRCAVDAQAGSDLDRRQGLDGWELFGGRGRRSCAGGQPERSCSEGTDEELSSRPLAAAHEGHSTMPHSDGRFRRRRPIGRVW